MTRDQLGARVRAIFSHHVAVLSRALRGDRVDVADCSRIVADLLFDSLDTIEVVLMIEDEFDLEIPDADLVAIVTVGDVIAYLTGRLELAEAA